MNISSTHIKPRSTYTQSRPTTPSPQEETSAPAKETFSSGASFGEAALGIGLPSGMGAVGVGAPAALGMGAIKSFMNGNVLLGVGLGAAAAGVGATVGFTSLGLAGMTTDSGSNAGLMVYGAGAALSTAAAAVAIF